MARGLIGTLDEYRMLLSASGSASGSVNYHWSALVTTVYAADLATDILTGGAPNSIGIELTGTYASVPNQRTYGLLIPALFYVNTWTYSGTATLDAEMILTDLEIWCDGTDYILEVGAMELKIEGASIATWGAQTFTGSGGSQPCAIPLIGAGCHLTCGCGSNPVVPLGGPYTSGRHVEVTLAGGMKIKQDGAYLTVPVSIHGDSNASGSASHNVVIDAEEDYSGVYTAHSGYVLLLPGWDRGIVRLNSPYEASWYRTGFHEYGVRHIHNVKEWQGSGGVVLVSDTTTTTDTQTHAAHNPKIELATATTATIDDQLGETIYCPFMRRAAHVTSGTGGSFDFIETTDSWGLEELSMATRPSWAPQPSVLAVLLSHADPVARYINTWANPIFSIAYWFPSNSMTEPQAWGIGTSGDLWLRIRQQHSDDPTMTAPEQTRRRVDLVSAPLLNSSLASGLINNSFHIQTSFVGIVRPEVFDVSPLASKTVSSSSSSRWSATGGTITHGGSIAVGAGVTRVEFDLTSYSVTPYMLTSWAKAVAVGWAGLTGVTVSIVGVDGSTSVLGTAGGTYTIPQFAATHWAGSWGQDFGSGVIADTYNALAANDDSATVDQAHYAYGPTRSGEKLRFDFTAAAGTETITYPTFTGPDLTGVGLYYSCGRHGELVIPSGSHQRMGVLSYAGGSASVPGLIQDQATLRDALGWRNHFALAEAADTNVLTNAQAEFDATHEAPNLSALETDFGAFAHKVPAGLKWITTYGLREIAPLGLLPRKKRDSDFAETGAYGQWSYTYAQRDHHVVAPFATKLVMGSDLLTALTAPAGWRVYSYGPAVDNTEGYDATVRSGAVDFAEVRPWRGYFWVGGSGSLAGGVTYHVFSARHVVGVATDGTAEVGITDNLHPQAPSLASAGDAQSICIRWLHSGELIRWVHDDTDAVLESRSQDGGLSWSTMARTVTSSGRWPAGFVGADERKRVYWVDGDTIKGEITDAQNNVIESTFTVVASSVADAGIAVWESVIGSTRRVILWYTDDAGALTEVISEDGGKTFA